MCCVCFSRLSWFWLEGLVDYVVDIVVSSLNSHFFFWVVAVLRSLQGEWNSIELQRGGFVWNPD